ncbi:DUF1289 domain-containing protein [Pseudoalteromonas tunicata]|jgi:predicted Fe-S protein YdhL (DUF1289 family)|uniref:DUF1289 domain-containing protein n=1 Tax=Pseudoalteromonas tunicata D2 TaxID=87626 RepID=A4C9C5_9GAMM|nr:DUF1289 domain-containing protein [Pseudoalteromonas tunicata]ATC93694.1 hypothetical protein PTUN_a0993 [Pseudoalteromonas tunicata]AXT29522.1 DUF1289 domain-containing protein [Pseudoalteromonas tunicata]EAR29190.1 hypothetical protein PTD2_09099 [Pseudoalteromonas tunicata D2]MDP4983556.1 DUF1289 domain-containing protein [Pseudoalteromonas tunicata]MDP5211904.1 DUF1289 domain-containing protein [Pseudoalteromonas tunicata]
MQQIEIFEIPSPCIDVCQSNNRGYCIGCFRSRDERFNWQKMSDSEKKHVIALCLQRKRRSEQKPATSLVEQQGQQNDFNF